MCYGIAIAKLANKSTTMRILLLILLLSGTTYANIDTLYINSGFQMMVDSTLVPSIKLNETAVFSPKNFVFKLDVNQEKNYCIINTDSVTHELYFKNNTSTLILANDTVEHTLSYNSSGLYIYEDMENYPLYAHLGLSGMVYVGSEFNYSYYWNLKEHDVTWINSTMNSVQVNTNEYAPQYYTINGLSNPMSFTDSSTTIYNQVGDLIYINIANTGRMNHTLHFHGYHVEIIYSSKDPHHEGRIKDSFNVKPLETIIVKLIPDKPGIYPVHDHNLGATLGNGTYANGMLTFLNIVE